MLLLAGEKKQQTRSAKAALGQNRTAREAEAASRKPKRKGVLEAGAHLKERLGSATRPTRQRDASGRELGSLRIDFLK